MRQSDPIQVEASWDGGWDDHGLEIIDSLLNCEADINLDDNKEK